MWRLETSASPAPYIEPLHQAPPVVVEVVGAVGCGKKTPKTLHLKSLFIDCDGGGGCLFVCTCSLAKCSR